MVKREIKYSKAKYKILAICLFIIIGVSTYKKSSTSIILPSVTGCPSTRADWETWRAKKLQEMNKPEDLIQLKEEIMSCLPGGGVVPACLEPILNTAHYMKLFVKGNLDPDGEMAAQINVLTPNDRDDVNDLPQGFEPQDLLKIAGFDPTSPEEFSDAISVVLSKSPKQTQAFSYLSNFAKDYGLIFFSPDPAIDKYVHYDLDLKLDYKFVISLNIEKKDRNGQLLQQPRPFYNVFSLSETQAVRDQTKNLVHCIICHQAGAMPVGANSASPVIAYGAGLSSENILFWFNNTQVASTANVKLPGIPNTGRSPQMAPVNFSGRDDAFMQSCIGQSGAKVDPARFKAVERSMNCASCHMGHGGIATVSHPFDEGSFNTSLLDTFILGGVMPPRTNDENNPNTFLYPEERKALLFCLRSEYYGGFRDPSLGGSGKMGSFMQDLLRVRCENK